MNRMGRTIYSLILSLFMVFAVAQVPEQNVAYADDDSITINSFTFVLHDDADGNGYANIGDTVRAEVDIDNTDSGCVHTSLVALVNMTIYGGSSSAAMTCVFDGHGSNDIMRLDFVIADAGVEGVDLSANDGASAVVVTVSDDDEDGAVGNPLPNALSNALGDGVVDTNTTNGVDTAAPTLAATSLEIDASACTGTAGVCIIGDEMTFTWRNDIDGNANVGTLTFDLTNFGGFAGTVVADDGFNGDATAGDDVFSYLIEVDDDVDDDDGVFSFDATLTDDAGHSVTVSSDATASVDNIEPTMDVSSLELDASGCTGTGGICKIGDVVLFTWRNDLDNNTDVGTVKFDLSSFGGGTEVFVTDDASNGDVTAGDEKYQYAYTIVAGAQDIGKASFDARVYDDGGNPSEPGGSKQFATVDNIAPDTLLDFSMPSMTFEAVNLQWTSSVVGDFAEYQIYYSTASGVDNTNGTLIDKNTYANLATISTNSTSFPATPLTTYFATAYVVDDAGNLSAAAAEVQGTTPVKPGGSNGSLISSGGGGGGLVLGETTTSEEEEEEVKTEEPKDEGKFTDISGHWAEFYIEALRVAGIVDGKEPGVFSPDSIVTRAEFLKMAMESAGVEIDETAKNNYSDVSSSDWFYKYVVTADALGFVEGYGDGTFMPNQKISRVEALAMALEVYGIDYGSDVNLEFPDTDSKDWYAALLTYSLGQELVNGYEDGKFGPHDALLRSEAAKIISLMMVN